MHETLETNVRVKELIWGKTHRESKLETKLITKGPKD